MQPFDILQIWSWQLVGQQIFDRLARAADSALSDSGPTPAQIASRHLWQEVKWKRSSHQYRNRVLRSVETTRVLGNPKPISIPEIYTDVLIFDQAGAFRRSELEAREFTHVQQHEDQYEKRPGLDAVLSGDNLYVLGRPGAGKTTFLKHVAYLACSGKIPRTPIFVALREHKLEATSIFWNILKLQFANCNLPDTDLFLQHILDNDRAILLLDGLDEVPESNGARGNLINQLAELSKQYPRTQICISCRIAATEYTFEQFDYVEVADFSDEQKRQFISRWFEYDKDRSHRFESQWNAASASGLRELARTPLLLAMICLSFEDNLALPLRRVNIFDEAIDTLIRKWDVSRNIDRESPLPGIKRHRYEHLFCELASRSFIKDKLLFGESFIVGQIIEWVEALPKPEGRSIASIEVFDFLASLEADTGLIVNRAKRTYSFSHLAIQEYFVAKSWTTSHASNGIDVLAAAYLTERKWREVFLFAAELAGDGTTLVHAMSSCCQNLLNSNSRALTLHEAANRCLRRIALNPEDKEGAIEEFSTNLRETLRRRHLDAAVCAPPDANEVFGRLRSLHATLKEYDFKEQANFVAVLHLVFKRHWALISANIDVESTGEWAARATKYCTYLQAVSLAVECAGRASCRRRAELVWRSLRGG